MNAYQLKPWTQIVTPHPDILEGRLDTSHYAASLGAVIRQDSTCPRVYRDAREFFKATYLTKELRKLLEDVLRGLQGERGDRVLQLRTPFGGGKTHALVSLYHIATSRDRLQDFPDLSTLPNPGQVKVAEFIGNDLDPTIGIQIENGSHILTPWGHLAWQIGGAEAYALVETADRQRIAPGNDVLRKIFGNKSILLLMDEVLVYVSNAMGLVVGDSTFGRQVLTFVQKLTEVVRELPKTVLVYSLQASVQEAVGDEGLLNILDKLVSRIDAKKEPVSGDEVMKVIQRRLFTNVGDPAVIQEIALSQAELFRKYRESFEDTSRGKQEVQQQADLLAERIQFSYPFHPDLLDLMYYRWGSLPSYQRTRGALQFLARVVYALHSVGDTSLLIGAGSIPFDDEGVRGAFFSQVNERERYITVIAADLIGRKAKVKAVDKRIAQDSPALSVLKVGTRLASAILMYSFGTRNGEDRGVMEQEVTAACLAPGLDRNTIAATLSDLREQLLYLHYVGRRYRFETKANLNKLIADEEEKISADDVLEKIKTELSKILQTSRGKVVLWAKDSIAIADNESRFSIAYLNPDWAEKSREAVLADAMTWLEQRGKDKREYKNALAFVVPHKAEMDKARKGARNALAIASLLEQKAKYKFTAEDIEEFNSKAKDANSVVSAALRRLYEYILLPLPCKDGTNPIRLETIDLQSQLNTSQNLQDRILDALKNHVFDTIKPAKLFQHSGLDVSETGYIKAEDLAGFFFRFPNLPKILDIAVIQKAIIKAIEEGNFGYIPFITVHSNSSIPTIENANLISFKRVINPDELDLSGYLLSPKLVTQLIDSIESKQSTSETSPNSATEDNSSDVVEFEKSKYDLNTNSSQILAGENKKLIEYQTSSIKKTVLDEIVKGKKPARHYKIATIAKKFQIFQLFEVLQALSDKADDMDIQIEIRAHTKQEFDPNWIRNAIEEPLDEMDIQANTHLE
ncbi:MAG: hypothetical protein N4J56_002904 [Chroococcidiopsis sp. SAG 2025]|uniref:ATP-binding protein n=1 Tax=Chroococcidiopsis sp. SAG 2025 TaxID=171389 RepID=UPI0029373448|nr:DUF499 domain-containing protein [Chroococcidiopsis sp. SAG 2025]MDV2993250.1 hypothetical protein [Chroococcidiopsis sp. SAG 2025]